MVLEKALREALETENSLNTFWTNTGPHEEPHFYMKIDKHLQNSIKLYKKNRCFASSWGLAMYRPPWGEERWCAHLAPARQGHHPRRW